MSDRMCSVAGCSRTGTLQRGMCGMHYQRHKAGTALNRPPRPVWAGAPCTVAGCETPITAKGLCFFHWQRADSGYPLDAPRRVRNAGQPCAISDCGKLSRKRGWCVKHYDRWARHGDPLINRAAVKGTCSVATCEREHYAHGYCLPHSRRAVRGKPLDKPFRPRTAAPCSFDGCTRGGRFRGLCSTHRDRLGYLADPEPFKARVALRRQRTGKLTAEEREISDAYRYAIRDDLCAYCGSIDAQHVDHVFPLAKGGTNHWWNLTRACRHCNLTKHARCGTKFKLMTGAWLVPTGPVATVAEADTVHR